MAQEAIDAFVEQINILRSFAMFTDWPFFQLAKILQASDGHFVMAKARTLLREDRITHLKARTIGDCLRFSIMCRNFGKNRYKIKPVLPHIRKADSFLRSGHLPVYKSTPDKIRPAGAHWRQLPHYLPGLCLLFLFDSDQVLRLAFGSSLARM